MLPAAGGALSPALSRQFGAAGWRRAGAAPSEPSERERARVLEVYRRPTWALGSSV